MIEKEDILLQIETCFNKYVKPMDGSGGNILPICGFKEYVEIGVKIRMKLSPYCRF